MPWSGCPINFVKKNKGNIDFLRSKYGRNKQARSGHTQGEIERERERERESVCVRERRE